MSDIRAVRAGIGMTWTRRVEDEREVEVTLIARVIDRDSVALGDLYDRYKVVVYGLARRITGNADDADDVTQTVFLGLPLALQRFERRGSLEGWLRRVTVTTALKLIEKEAGAVEITEVIWRRFGSRNEERRMLARLTLAEALDCLPLDDRAVIVLKDLQGYTHQEIGEILGITPGASAVRLHRARERLKGWLVARE